MESLENSIGIFELHDEINGSSSDSDIQILEEQDESGQYESFVIDTSTQEQQANEAEANNANATSTSLNLSTIISHFDEPKKEVDRRSKGRMSGQACFNCSSTEHNAAKCPHPRNGRRISQNISMHRKRREGSGRFHANATAEEEIKPGRISAKLRQALGIGERELPEWIYRMRNLGFIEGYPPAYRKRATELATFEFHEGVDNATVSNANSRKRKFKEEDGKILSIDPDKLPKYAGFNYDDNYFTDQKREKWVIPPFDKFADAQQSYLKQLDALERIARSKEQPPSVKRLKMENGVEFYDQEGEEDDDVLIVETRRSSIEEGEIMDEEEEMKIERTNVTVRRKRKKKRVTMKKIEIQSSSNAVMNELLANEPSASAASSVDLEETEKIDESSGNKSIPILETFIPMENHISTDRQNHEVAKPELQSFAKGIQPFQREQTEGRTGFFKKLHDIIRKERNK